MRKRSCYRPRGFDPNGGITLLTKNHLLTDEEIRSRAMKHWGNLEVIVKSDKKDHRALQALVDSLNTAMVLCELGVEAESLQLVIDAQIWAFNALYRFERGKGLGLTAEGLKAVRIGLGVHDAQIMNATKGDLGKAATEIARRQAAGDVFRAEDFVRVLS